MLAVKPRWFGNELRVDKTAHLVFGCGAKLLELPGRRKLLVLVVPIDVVVVPEEGADVYDMEVDVGVGRCVGDDAALGCNNQSAVPMPTYSPIDSQSNQITARQQYPCMLWDLFLPGALLERLQHMCACHQAFRQP